MGQISQNEKFMVLSPNELAGIIAAEETTLWVINYNLHQLKTITQNTKSPKTQNGNTFKYSVSSA